MSDSTYYQRNQRLLIIDDNPVIHDDIRKVLGSGKEVDSDFADDDAFLFGDDSKCTTISCHANLTIDSAYQGQEAYEIVTKACEENNPYPVAIVDMRMPPGWDGLETVQRLWQVDPSLLVIFCTAFSDYTWSEMVDKLGVTDRFVILKKPFDNAEMQQLVAAMIERWHAARDASINFQQLNLLNQQKRELELQVEALKAQLEGSHSTEPVKLNSQKILVVDPNTLERQDTVKSLLNAGGQVIDHEHPEDAINEIQMANYQAEPFGAVVTELKFPDQSGYDFVREVRSIGFKGSVIAFTNQSLPGDNEAAKNAGCTDYLLKSTGVHQLLSKISLEQQPQAAGPADASITTS